MVEVKLNIYQKLLNIQAELKAPKNQFNSFGKYNYRSCEDILEGLKPLLRDNKAVVTLHDSVEQIGDRFYIKATATLISVENGEKIETTALAREDESKKGMDLAQVTGSVSSYARKYALNGLFCIDDTKDSDTTNKHDKGENTPPKTSPPAPNFQCEVCGKQIQKELAEHCAKANNGHVYCSGTCKKKAEKESG